MTLQLELLNKLLKGDRNLQHLLGEGEILNQLTKALLEWCWSAEIDERKLECDIASAHAGLRFYRPRSSCLYADSLAFICGLVHCQ